MSRTCVTVKYGKGYEETWAVFEAESIPAVRSSLLDYFGVEASTVTELTLHEVVLNCTALAHGSGNAAAMLGAVAIAAPQTASKDVRGKVWSDDPDPDPGPAPRANEAVYQAIEAAASVSELQRVVYKAHQEAINADPDLVEAYKAKGTALKAAGKL